MAEFIWLSEHQSNKQLFVNLATVRAIRGAGPRTPHTTEILFMNADLPPLLVDETMGEIYARLKPGTTDGLLAYPEDIIPDQGRGRGAMRLRNEQDPD